MDREINVKQLIDTILKRRKKQYIVVLSIVFVVSVIYAYSLPRYYKTEVQIIPETSSSGGLSIPSSLRSVASIAGISTGSTSEDAINPEIYPDIFNSTTFILDLFDITVQPTDSAPTSYYDYLTKGQKKPWWAIDIFPKKKKKEPTVINPNYLTKEQTAVVKNIMENITCLINKKTGMISLSAQAQDPVVSAQLADSIMAKLQEYIIRYRTTKARGDLEYINGLYDEAKEKYLDAQRRYAEFEDANQELVLSSYRITTERLENEMQLAYNVYSQVAQQQQIAQAKLQERIPAFTVIQSSVVPLRPAGPKRTQIVFFALFFTTVIMSCIFLYKEIKHTIGKQEAAANLPETEA